MAQAKTHMESTDELRREKERAQNYLDIAQVILVAIDNQARITLLNRKGHQALGYENGELIGKDWFRTCLPQYEYETVLNIFNKIISGELEIFEHYENHVLTKTGQKRLISWHNSLLHDEAGRIIGTLSSGEDITERKQAELKLEISEARYRTLFEQTADYVLVLEPNDEGPPIITDANEAAFVKFGYARSELIGKPITFLDRGSSKDIIFERTRLLRTGMLAHFEVEHVRKDGSTFWADVAARCVTIGGKNLFYSVERDITERKKIERDLTESMHNLETKELSKSRFFAAAGHDLRQPLAAANLFIDALKRTEPTPPSKIRSSKAWIRQCPLSRGCSIHC